MRQGDRLLKADCLQYDADEPEREDGRRRRVLRPEGHRPRQQRRVLADARHDSSRAPSSSCSTAARAAARESLQVGSDGKVTLNRVSFTTCPASDQAWQITAHQIEIDTRERVGRSRGAKVEFKGVPLLYLPYLASRSRRRKTGFLFPSFGHSSRSGAQIDDALLLEHPARTSTSRRCRPGTRSAASTWAASSAS